MTATFDLRASDLPAKTLAKFPAEPFAGAASYCDAYFEELARAAASIDFDDVERAASVLLDAYTRGASVFSCGNGGSAAISNHLQCDHLKGVRTETDLSPRVLSLSSNIELLTAIANDIGYNDVFVYQLQSQCRPGDVLITISSSGRSPNIVQALQWPASTTSGRSPSRASRAVTPGNWPRSQCTSSATTTGSSKTCISRSCTPLPSTSVSLA